MENLSKAIIGGGGYGIVSKVEHEGKFYALKELRRNLPYDAFQRFGREKEVLEKLNQLPNADEITVPMLSKGEDWYVMPFCDDGTLEEWVERCPENAQPLELLETIVKPLQKVHELGITHNDIKPGKINTSFPL